MDKIKYVKEKENKLMSSPQRNFGNKVTMKAQDPLTPMTKLSKNLQVTQIGTPRIPFSNLMSEQIHTRGVPNNRNVSAFLGAGRRPKLTPGKSPKSLILRRSTLGERYVKQDGIEIDLIAGGDLCGTHDEEGDILLSDNEDDQEICRINASMQDEPMVVTQSRGIKRKKDEQSDQQSMYNRCISAPQMDAPGAKKKKPENQEALIEIDEDDHFLTFKPIPSEENTAMVQMRFRRNRRIADHQDDPDTSPYSSDVKDRRSMKYRSRTALGPIQVSDEMDYLLKIDPTSNNHSGDYSQPPVLKIDNTVPNAKLLYYISADTFLEVMEKGIGDWAYLIVDCRYPFEFEGGHIKGAINIWDFNTMKSYFFSRDAPWMKQKTLIIFHCEFSSERAPKMFQEMRSYDRSQNQYPHLHYPEMYVLNGGYRNLYHLQATPEEIKAVEETVKGKDEDYIMPEVEQKSEQFKLAVRKILEPVEYRRMDHPGYSKDLRKCNKTRKQQQPQKKSPMKGKNKKLDFTEDVTSPKILQSAEKILEPVEYRRMDHPGYSKDLRKCNRTRKQQTSKKSPMKGKNKKLDFKD